MRDIYHDELDDLGKSVLKMTNLVALAMGRATAALLDADLAMAERVIAGDARIDVLRRDLEDRCFTLIAQQQPVATDLRALISTIHLAGDLERMGDLAQHVARVARLRFPALAAPGEAGAIIARMGEVARTLVTQVSDVVNGRDVELAASIEREDDAMDALRREMFALVLASDWAHGTEAAIDLTLLGRYYERYADHAVAVARHTVFIVTGVRPTC